MKTTATVFILITFSSPCLADAELGTREVLLDNEAVEVVRLTYPAGSESGMHTHRYPNRVAYVVQGGKLEMVPGDSDEPRQSLEVADGQAIYLPAATHNVRNVGDTEIVIIETEIK
jgi:mannose-6-phosphate isomerase-like protein (cupin superfamily)